MAYRNPMADDEPQSTPEPLELACWFWSDRRMAFANAQYIVRKVLIPKP